MMFRAALVTFATIALSACPPSPTPPAPDSGDASTPSLDGGATDCNIMCANIGIVGCAAGLDPKCSTTCQHVRATHITNLDLPCLTRARTKAEVRACGTVNCP